MILSSWVYASPSCFLHMVSAESCKDEWTVRSRPKERRKKSSGCIIPRRGRICKHLFCKLHFFREENFGIGWNCNFKGKRLVTSAPAGARRESLRRPGSPPPFHKGGEQERRKRERTMRWRKRGGIPPAAKAATSLSQGRQRGPEERGKYERLRRKEEAANKSAPSHL